MDPSLLSLSERYEMEEATVAGGAAAGGGGRGNDTQRERGRLADIWVLEERV